MKRNDILRYRRFLMSKNEKGQSLIDILIAEKKKKATKLMNSLFGEEEDDSLNIDYSQFSRDILTDNQLINYEREVLGVNLLNVLGNNIYKINQYCNKNIAWVNENVLDNKPFDDVMLGVVITKMEYKTSKKGNSYYNISISDSTGSVKLFCSMDMIRNSGHILAEDRVVFARVKYFNDFLTLQSISDIDDIPYRENTCIVLKTDKYDFEKRAVVIDNIMANIEDGYIKKGNEYIYSNNFQTNIKIQLTTDILDWIENELKVDFSIEIKEPFITYYTDEKIEEIYSHLEEKENDFNELLWK